MENKSQIENQIRSMGASVDWSRYTFTLDKKVIETVYQTFKKLHDDGLVYRGEYLVNYCPKCGTTFADLEVSHIERKDPLYYLRYGPFVLATVRPETKSLPKISSVDKKYPFMLCLTAAHSIFSQRLKIIKRSLTETKVQILAEWERLLQCLGSFAMISSRIMLWRRF